MALPLLLGLGLLAGNEYMRQQGIAGQEAEDLALLQRLRGQPGVAYGPPDEQGKGPAPMGGSGLLADPTNPQAQMMFAQGLLDSPRMRAAALQMLDASWGRGQRAQEFTASQGQQQRQFDVTEARYGKQADTQAQQWQAGRDDALRGFNEQVRQWSESFNQQGEQNAFSRQQDRERLGLERERVGLARTAAGVKAADTMGAIPAGMELVPGPGGKPMLAPLPGSEQYKKAVDSVGAFESAIQDLDELANLVGGAEKDLGGGRKVRTGGYGSEMFPTDAAARMSSIYARTVASIGALDNLGTLQPGDLERINDSLPNPAAKWSTMRPTSNMVKTYEETRDQFKRKLDAHRRANPWLAPPLPPGFKPLPGAQ